MFISEMSITIGVPNKVVVKITIPSMFEVANMVSEKKQGSINGSYYN